MKTLFKNYRINLVIKIICKREMISLLIKENEYNKLLNDHEEYFPSIGTRKQIKVEANLIRKNQFGNTVTVSRNYFVPLIKYCRNNCLYCGFSRKSSNTNLEIFDNNEMIITPSTYKNQLKQAKLADCREILLVLGDRPEEISEKTRSFLEHNGFDNAIEYTKWACDVAIEMGLLPHVNVGVISKSEWEYLQPSIASAGLMLETTSGRLTSKGQAHQSSPDKIPSERIKSIKAALELDIPFTSGILVNIGESNEERLHTLEILSEFSNEFLSLQELIIQGFHPLPNTPWRDKAPTDGNLILDTISACRILTNSRISIQFPPNLGSFETIHGILHGANDLGGVSPLSIDYVNYTSSWPHLDKLKKDLKEHDIELVERGPVYKEFVKFSPLTDDGLTICR
ncbi:MAG: 7,8-didemethyl-8-hydroxy-5-deazariboflavin synthase CofG [Candidatus Heimdallarchaeota archaeon]|nr:7,8-didemethyl-8-hydroxy-5-deazariboflavin synthase CofG [Candidatus Heimdallarchaeota archaeon]